MEKNKILEIISIILFIIGWIAYSKLGIALAIIIEIGALVLAIISAKKKCFCNDRNYWFNNSNCYDDSNIVRKCNFF